MVKLQAAQARRLLKPVAPPPQEIVDSARGAIFIAESSPQAAIMAEPLDSNKLGSDPMMIDKVVAENDRAWEMLQSRLRVIRDEPDKAFSMHDGFLQGSDMM